MAKNILIVDDDTDYLFQQKVQLEKLGYKVTTFDNTADAKVYLNTTKPDLTIVDLMMDEMDAGFSMAFHIKSKYPDMPVIMITAVTSETGLEFDVTGKASWIKADALLTKPIRIEQLVKEMKGLFGE
jgi:DNA-binding response OmpR family regulator